MVEAERALIAAKDGDLQTLRSLRRLAPVAADGFGATALHYAARTGQMECVKWLAEAIGISPNVRGTSGATPLHDAAAQGQLECVEYFLGSGVDAETRDRSGHTALHLAARFGRFETVKWLIEKGNSNARAKSRNHMTPVHFAASGGHLTCLQLLVFKAGYSCVHDVATDGTTPLYLATQDGNLDCLKYLHSVGGKCDAKARDGMLPIHGAAQNGHLDCVGYLIESGQADLNERDTTGATAAHFAAAQGHVSVLKWLNAKGDISTIDNLGGSPLHDAAEQGQFECIRYLVENIDLDVNQADREGLTPLALAEKSGHRKCIDYLKIATSRQAKAQKRQMETKNQPVDKDTKIPILSPTTPNVKIPTQSELTSEKPVTKMSSAAHRESLEGAPKQHVVENNTTNKNSNCSNDKKAEKAEKTQTKQEFPLENPVTKKSFVAWRESPEQTSKHHTATGKSNNNNNDSNNNDNNKKGEPAKENTANTASSSSVTATQSPPTAGSSLGTTQPMEQAKPLRERQLQPLPHFGDIRKSPAQTSEHHTEGNESNSSGNKEGTSHTQAKRDFPSEKPAAKESSVAQGESPEQALKHHTATNNNSSNNNKKKGESSMENTRTTNTASSSSVTAPQSPRTTESPLCITQPMEQVKPLRERQLQPLPHFGDVIPPPLEFSESSGSSPLENELCGDESHVTSTEWRHRRIDESLSEEFERELPPWKKQMLVNRRFKEKADREKRGIEERKWIGVAPWKIPLLAKREDERLKEEQRLAGMPEWKKSLLSKRGTGQIYHENKPGKLLRRTRSADPCNTTQSTVWVNFTRPRGFSSLE